MKEFYITDGQIPLHVKLEIPDNSQNCPIVILVHGLRGHMEERPIVVSAETMLACGYAVIRAELYGHGKSGGTYRKHTLANWIDSLQSVIRYAKSLPFVTKIYLCGHSQGGLAAMLAAEKCTDDISGMILLAPAVNIPDGARKGCLLDAIFDPQNIPDELILYEHMISADYFRIAQKICIENAISSYPHPVLAILAEQDALVPLPYAKAMLKQYPDCTICTIPGDNHDFDHHPDLLSQAIAQFLNAKEKGE